MTKILRNYKRGSESTRISVARGIYQLLSSSDKVKALKPQIDSLKTGLDAYQVLSVDARYGGTDRTSAKNNCLTTILEVLDEIVPHVEIMSKTDDSIIGELGFEEFVKTKTRANQTAITELPEPLGFKVSNVEKSGVVKASWLETAGADTYSIAHCIGDSTVWAQENFSVDNKSTLISDLPRGKMVKFKLRGMTVTGVLSDWSPVVEVNVD